jgi:hypothetical protein
MAYIYKETSLIIIASAEIIFACAKNNVAVQKLSQQLFKFQENWNPF